MTNLVGKGKLSVRSSSDGLSSPVEDEPLLLVLWLGVSDSKSVLLLSNVLSHDESSSGLHLGFDLEENSISEWVLVVLDSLSVEVPGLVQSIVAVPEDDMSVVGVLATVNIKALSAVVSDVSSWSSVEDSSLVWFLLPWSHGGSNIDLVFLTLLIGENKLSVLVRSDSSSSSVEDEPLSVILWVVVLDSESELTLSN